MFGRDQILPSLKDHDGKMKAPSGLDGYRQQRQPIKRVRCTQFLIRTQNPPHGDLLIDQTIPGRHPGHFLQVILPEVALNL
ncbi:MAG: hypothetical protein GTN74_11185 [Proteobacteria bacterium]|nr:hypothetical protein [Pseudomonadota bacterium]NIS71324.1 hypothetical protein [Pseudomonadota bacterium]